MGQIDKENKLSVTTKQDTGEDVRATNKWLSYAS